MPGIESWGLRLRMLQRTEVMLLDCRYAWSGGGVDGEPEGEKEGIWSRLVQLHGVCRGR